MGPDCNSHPPSPPQSVLIKERVSRDFVLIIDPFQRGKTHCQLLDDVCDQLLTEVANTHCEFAKKYDIEKHPILGLRQWLIFVARAIGG